MPTSKNGYLHNNVLLVDDNELDNFINQKIMAANHFAERVYTASNGKSAIDFMRNLVLMDPSLYPEVIFIDLNMPLMDGFQLLEFCSLEQNIRNRKIRLVVLTSSVNEHDKTRIESHFSDVRFINKPLTTDTLMKADQ